MPFPFAALAATAVSADTQSRQQGGAGLFEINSLFRGPQAGDQYGAFKPGGMFAPPSFADFTGAAKGRDVGRTIGQALAPGLGAGLAALISGPGRGNTRRAGARDLVARSPELTTLQRRLLGAGGQASTAEVHALASIVSEARSLGGLGSKFGERANFLQDVVKFLFTGETASPKRPFPTLEQLEVSLGSVGTRQALPVGGPVPMPMTARSGSYWAGTAYRV